MIIIILAIIIRHDVDDNISGNDDNGNYDGGDANNYIMTIMVIPKNTDKNGNDGDGDDSNDGSIRSYFLDRWLYPQYFKWVQSAKGWKF